MPLQIDRVNTQVDVVPSGENGNTVTAYDSVSDSDLLERLKPFLIEIMKAEIDSILKEAR